MNKDEISELKKEIVDINKKLDLVLDLLKNDIQKSSKKMTEHIDFIENVYNTVKSPLGYLCNKINYFSQSNNTYTLENIEETHEDYSD
jgi:hypothetical protein